MTIYFTASVAARPQLLKNYQLIINTVNQKGHTIIADHILHVSNEELQLKTAKERLNFHKKLEDWIDSCDFMIVEASFPSISVGYEVSLALQRGKPVLILYSEGYPPSLFAYHENEKLVCEKYSSENINELIGNFIDYVKGVHDTRFTFFITPKISAYLDKISRKSKIPKSVYLRQLIEEDMNKK